MGYGFGGAEIETPELGLLNNGGLFIIVIFLLIYCSCAKGSVMPTATAPTIY